MLALSALFVVLAMESGSAAPRGYTPSAMCSNPARLYPHPEDCHTFFRCINGKPVAMHCPPRTAFDPDTQVCAWRVSKDGCGLKPSSPTGWIDAITNTYQQSAAYNGGANQQESSKAWEKAKQKANNDGFVTAATVSPRSYYTYRKHDAKKDYEKPATPIYFPGFNNQARTPSSPMPTTAPKRSRSSTNFRSVNPVTYGQQRTSSNSFGVPQMTSGVITDTVQTSKASPNMYNSFHQSSFSKHMPVKQAVSPNTRNVLQSTVSGSDVLSRPSYNGIKQSKPEHQTTAKPYPHTIKPAVDLVSENFNTITKQDVVTETLDAEIVTANDADEPITSEEMPRKNKSSYEYDMQDGMEQGDLNSDYVDLYEDYISEFFDHHDLEELKYDDDDTESKSKNKEDFQEVENSYVSDALPTVNSDDGATETSKPMTVGDLVLGVYPTLTPVNANVKPVTESMEESEQVNQNDEGETTQNQYLTMPLTYADNTPSIKPYRAEFDTKVYKYSEKSTENEDLKKSSSYGDDNDNKIVMVTSDEVPDVLPPNLKHLTAKIVDRAVYESEESKDAEPKWYDQDENFGNSTTLRSNVSTENMTTISTTTTSKANAAAQKTTAERATTTSATTTPKSSKTSTTTTTTPTSKRTPTSTTTATTTSTTTFTPSSTTKSSTTTDSTTTTTKSPLTTTTGSTTTRTTSAAKTTASTATTTVPTTTSTATTTTTTITTVPTTTTSPKPVMIPTTENTEENSTPAKTSPQTTTATPLTETSTVKNESSNTKSVNTSFHNEVNISAYRAPINRNMLSIINSTKTPAYNVTMINVTRPDQRDNVTAADVHNLSTPPTTTISFLAEGKMNVSFMSAPYMVKGLKRPFRCPESDGHFPDPRDCAVYYHCAGGVAYRRDCPLGQVFHHSVLACVSSNLAPPCSTAYMDTLEEDERFARSVCEEPNGLYRDPYSCSHYFECTNGWPIRRKCMAGTVFDNFVGKCSWSKFVPGCEREVTMETNSIAKKKLFECPRDGYFRDPELCGIYYLCAGGDAVRMSCDPGTSFDITLNMCVWNSLVGDCDEDGYVISEKWDGKDYDVVPDESNYVTEEKFNSQYYDYESGSAPERPGSLCPEANGIFPDEDDCSIYYTCKNYVAKRMRCPFGTGYDMVTGICIERIQVARCAMGKVYDDTSFNTVVDAPPYACPEAHGLYPDPYNCSAFIHCFKKIAYRHQCQPGTVFSPETAACTWRHLVPECQKGTETKAKAKDIVEGKNKTEGKNRTEGKDKSEGKKKEWSKKSRFDDKRQKNSVAQGKNRNHVHIEPYQQSIQQYETPNANPRPVGLQDFQCPPVLDGFFRDNLFCDIFHRCVLGTRFTFTCPTGTFFRLEGNLCDFWETVSDCTQDGVRLEAIGSMPEVAPLPQPVQRRVPVPPPRIPQPPPRPVPEPVPHNFDVDIVSIDADPTPCPAASGLFAHPRNCRQFLFCAHYVPLVLTCPKSLLYNAQTLTCDFAKNVQCVRYDEFSKK